MSDPIETTAAGATRTFFGALGFILLMVGVEGMTGQAPLTVFSAAVCVALGASCFYLAFFWERAKTHLSGEAQQAIGTFAQNRIVKFGMIFLVLLTLILSPFIEQRRWPFSYAADPSVFTERDRLRNEMDRMQSTLSQEKELADKWRFSSGLRQSGLNCRYLLMWSVKDSPIAAFWRDLFIASGWLGDSQQEQAPTTPPGVTIRTKDNVRSTQCAEIVQQKLGEYYPNPPAKIIPQQQTSFLNACDRDACIQIEVNY
jgi:hypothetical protein